MNKDLLKQRTNDKLVPDYERRFWRIAFMHLPHHSLLRLALRRDSKRLKTALDRSARRVLGPQKRGTFSDEEVQKYREITSHTDLWHGTGRLQYSQAGTVDILQAVLQQGHLKPTRDVYMMIFTGKEMMSLSATRLRILARSYADTHGVNINEQDRYGSALWWVGYYYGLGYLELVTQHRKVMRKNWETFDRASRDNNGERVWGKKVHSSARTVWDTFGLGSDIPGNYPVLFGIRKGAQLEPLPKNLAKWEMRIIAPVEMSQITHIEVPRDEVEQTGTLLKKYGYDIPVFSIEIGEFMASQQDIGSLLYPA